MEYKIGDIVYCIGGWNKDCVFKGEVIPDHYIYNEAATLRIDKIIHEFKNTYIEDDIIYGTQTFLNGELFSNPKEAFEEIKRRDQEEYKELASEINTIEDLVRFPLNHCFCGEEYTEWIAIKVYKDKAKDLLKLNL